MEKGKSVIYVRVSPAQKDKLMRWAYGRGLPSVAEAIRQFIDGIEAKKGKGYVGKGTR